MEYITDDILKKIVLSCGESDDVEKVISKESEAAVGHGDNYCSDIDRVKIKLQLTSGKVISQSVVLKLFLKNLDSAALHELRKFWANESTVYEKILVQMESLAEQYHLKNPRLWPKCYFSNDDVIIMDDLKDKGYVLAPRQQGMRIEDGFTVMRYIAKLHALSIVAEKRKMFDPRIIRSPYTWVQLEGTWTYEFIKKIFTVSGEVIMEWGGQWEDVGKRIKNRADTMSKTMNDLFYEKVKLNVVNHGDAWTNNIMVKYDADQRIESIRFVDYQNATYNSYGWDLTYYLYSSLVGDVMRTNFEQLLSCYQEEFKNMLKNLGEDPSIVPTLDKIKSEMDRLCPFGLSVAVVIQAAAFCTSKHAVQFNELVTDDYKARSLFNSDLWKLSMQTHLKYFIEKNVI